MAEKFMVKFQRLGGKLSEGWQRFPESLALAVVVVLFLVIMNHNSGEDGELSKVALGLALGIPYFMSWRLLKERLSVEWDLKLKLIYLIGVLGILVYYFWGIPDFKVESNIRYVGLILALSLTFLFIPYFYRREGYELYVMQVFKNFWTTYLYAIVFYLGIIAMFGTINLLFKTRFDRLFLDLWYLTVGVFAPAVFFGELPHDKQELTRADYPKVLQVILLYILMPMILIYTGILYLYFAQIIIIMKWPIGMVSQLVLWFSLLSMLVILLIYPFKSEQKWLERFLTIFPKLLLPLLGMMFVATLIRVKAYGITENRYFVLVAGLWVTGYMIYLCFVKNPRNILIPISGAIIAIISVIGPLSATSISKFSQNQRFVEILQRYQLLQAGKLVKPSKKLSLGARKEISKIIEYFDQKYSLQELKYLPQSFKISQMKKFFGFGLVNQEMRFDYLNYEFSNQGAFVEIAEYDYYLSYTGWASVGQGKEEPGLRLKVIRENSSNESPRDEEAKFSEDSVAVYQLKLFLDNKMIYQKDLKKLAGKLIGEKSGELKVRENNPALTYQDQNQQVKLLYVFRNLGGREDPDEKRFFLEQIGFDLFVKVAK